jgi:hypothetical protein
MNKPNVTKMFKDIQNGVSKHSPEILTGLGIAGMITTVVLAVKATPKALEKIEEAKTEKGEELTKLETVKVAWKPYIPAAITGTAAIGCLIGSSSVSIKRNAALATAYQLSSTALADYKEKVVETIGEKKEKTVRDKVAQKKVDEQPVNQGSIIVTGTGNTLCYDPQFGQLFETSIDAINKAVNTLNYRMMNGNEEYISLNEFYDEIGVPRDKQPDLGNQLGWNIGRDGLIEVDFSSAIKDGKPCIVLTYRVAPKYDYFKLN